MAVLTGFHGKLPVAGDFLTRGLPTGFAAFWDGWAARHLAGRQNWPDGGLRLRLASGGKVAAGVVVPGADRVGRRFPLAAFLVADALPGPAGLDPWCDAALCLLLQAQAEDVLPDALEDALADLAPPRGQAAGGAMQLWSRGLPAAACDAAEPQEVLERLFSCSGSSSP